MGSTDIKTIYIFTDWYVPGYRAGGPIQSVFNLATLLSRHLHVKVITRNTDYGSNKPYPDIIPDQWIFISPRHEVLYLSGDNISLKTIRNICKIGKNDMILINGLFSFYFSVLPLFFANYYGINKIFVAVRGMLHQSALNVKPLKKLAFLAFARGFGLYKKCILLSTSGYENEEIKKVLGRVKIEFAPNIPVSPLENETVFSKPFKSTNGELRLLFLGRISPEKNPVTLLRAFQEINYPVFIKFIGSGIDAGYQEIFENEITNLQGKVMIEWLKELPHREIQAVFATTDVLILPSHGENFGHAIFESFANATPVIIGNNTPWKGIEKSKAGIEVEPANNHSIRNAVNTFNKMNVEEYREWQKGALKQATDYFEANDFEKLYLHLLT